MALATLDDVTAVVGGVELRVSVTFDETGLVVGALGTIPWAGSAIAVEARPDGCRIHLTPPNGAGALFFLPVTAFSAFGGAAVMGTFAGHLARSAVALGAVEVQPAPA